MSRRKPARHHRDIITRADAGRRRSFEVPLLWLGFAAFVGYPVVRDATSDPMQRNRYGTDLQSCACDYGRDACQLNEGSWVGPWYARNSGDRAADDPGSGACRNGGSARGGYFSGYRDGYRSPTSVEAGYRGGFGGTGRVRAAGS